MSDGPPTGLVPSDVDTRGVTFTWGATYPGRTGSSKPPTTRPSTTKHLSVSTKSVSIKRAPWTNPGFSLGRSCGASHLAPGLRIPSGRRSVPRGGCTRSGSRHSGSCACRTGVDTSPRGPSSLPPTRPRSFTENAAQARLTERREECTKKPTPAIVVVGTLWSHALEPCPNPRDPRGQDGPPGPVAESLRGTPHRDPPPRVPQGTGSGWPPCWRRAWARLSVTTTSPNRGLTNCE